MSSDQGPAAVTPCFFVAFEGGEGAGKSTQAALLTARLRAEGREVVATREPGGSPIGTAVRALLLDPARRSLAARTEALLFAAERAEHVASVIRPALARGACVVCDRYIDSSVAYQGVGRGLDLAEVLDLSAWATQGLVPDLTVLLDVDPSVGFARFPASTADRIERESGHFHRRVAQAFRDLAAEHPERYLVLDAGHPAAAVAAMVRSEVLRRFGPPAPTGRAARRPARVAATAATDSQAPPLVQAPPGLQGAQ